MAGRIQGLSLAGQSVQGEQDKGGAFDPVMAHALKCVADFQKVIGKKQAFTLSPLVAKGITYSGFHVLRATSPQMDLVFKIDVNNIDPHRFQREALTQRRLHEVYEGHKNLRVPQVWHSSARLRYFVMDFAHGAGMQFAVRNHVSVEDEDRIFRQAGRWLGVLHRQRAVEMLPFDPNPRMAQLLARLDRETANETLYEPDDLRAFAQKLKAQIPAFQDLPNPACLGHGDFHSDNLVFDGETCTGLDFFNVRRMSAGSDIARILVHADLSQFEEESRIGPLGLVQSHVDAFFDGYRFDLTDAHPFAYLIRQRLLELWSRTAVPASNTGTAYDLLRRLRARAEIALGSGPINPTPPASNPR